MSNAEMLFKQIMRAPNPQVAFDEWCDQQREHGHQCEYGHIGDSDRDHGACLDELCHLAIEAGLFVP